MAQAAKLFAAGGAAALVLEQLNPPGFLPRVYATDLAIDATNTGAARTELFSGGTTGTFWAKNSGNAQGLIGTTQDQSPDVSPLAVPVAVHGLASTGVGVFGNGYQGIGVQGSGVTGVFGYAQGLSGVGVQAQSFGSGVMPLRVIGDADQTVDLQQWQNYLGDPVAKIDKDGVLVLMPRATDPAPDSSGWKLYVFTGGKKPELRLLGPSGTVNTVRSNLEP
jgi:hypothetical protein